jgi:predicted esterase
MRRLVPVLVVLGLALLGAASAAGAAPGNTIVVRAAGHAPIRVLLRVEGKTRVLGRAHGRGAKKPQRVTVSLRIPKHLPEGRWPVIVCVSHSCRRVSWVDGDGQGTHLGPLPPEAPSSPKSFMSSAGTAPVPAELGGDIAPPPISTVPTEPIPHPVGEPFFHAGGGVEYSAFIPRGYDATNQTPTKLFVWLHGCGGDAEGDAWVVDPGAEEGVEQDWMTLSLGGRAGGCWNPLAETEPLLLAAIADFETHFNVDRQRVILGGYSSGGDLAYRTTFNHSSLFAELLIENSAPFRDTEESQTELLGAATTKFPIVHLAHASDNTYRLVEVEPEIASVRAAGFPVEFIVKPGGHSDFHTDPDLINLLLPHIDDV